jgi:arsenite-transporting ATPase
MGHAIKRLGLQTMKFLDQPTRNLFFTGKGGVGKTSVACATAVRLADAGKKVLLVSTDPASNLDEVLGVALGNHPTAIPAIATLFAMNLDPEKSAAEYRERMVGPYRGLLPEAAVTSMEEQFSGSCTLEIAAFDEFSRLLGDPKATIEFDHVIFDTAPTGHTLRLLTLPSAWDGFMEKNTTGTSCLGPLAGLQDQQKLYQESVKALGDPAVTTLVLVARAEASALREAARTSGELAELGVRNQHLVVNGVFKAIDASDPYAAALEQRGSVALAAMPEGLKTFPQSIVALSPDGILGMEALRRLGKVDRLTAWATPRVQLNHVQTPRAESPLDAATTRPDGNAVQQLDLPMLSELIDDLVAPGHGVILAMGKGGVGKTTVAAAIAVAIAERGYEVHLSTTDPAAHIAAALNDESLPTLSVSRIDPEVETAKYSAEVLGKVGKNLDQQGKALLEEDLRSPCTEEIAVFRAFADAVAAGTNKFVVLDTAPTGHTVLLLDSALAYHREVTRQTSEMPEAVENLLPRLRDPNFTRVLIVTLPEATPVHEAAALQRDLRRAEIEPYAWVINQVLSPLPLTDPLMKQRQSHEQKYLREVKEVQASRLAIIPWQIVPPIGLQALSRLTHSQLTSADA